jgi:hypothetical protein
MSDEGLVDWFDAHAESVPRRKTPEVENFLTHIWPMGLPYASPLQPRFLIELERSGLRTGQGSFLIRDGLIPLLWFWKKWPSPDGFGGTLRVGEGFADHVPEAWRPRVRFYRLGATPGAGSVGEPIRRLILVGLMMPGYTNLVSLERRLKALGDLEDTEIFAFLPARFSQAGAHRMDFHLEFARIVLGRWGSRVQPLNWGFVESMDHGPSTSILDLSDGLLLNDCSVVHALLSRGARLHPEGTRPVSGQFTPVSPYHGYWITDEGSRGRQWRTPDELRQLAELTESLTAPAHQYFPWPTWFDDFCASL